jgi:MFS transporter, DHA2 family, methylenomycin A resistance protein
MVCAACREVSVFQTDRRLKVLTIGAMCFGLFMVMLDNTVVNLALPTIQRRLGAGMSELQWIVDAFVLLLASLMLTGGTIGDLYGRKRAFMGGLTVFTLGSLACALAPSVGFLIAARALQGVGAAVMMPNTLAILTNTFPDHKERAQAIGIWAGVSGFALALGPLLGGVMVDALGWQSIFYINVPIGAFALVMCLRVVRESSNPEGRSLDLPGQILAVVGLGALTYALIEANTYGWGSAIILSFFGIAVVALTAFVLVELRSSSPMLQLSFFRNTTFFGANLVGLLVSFAFFGMLMFLALFLQNIQGYSATRAGLMQLPTTAAVVVSSIISGRIVGRYGARAPITVGMVLLGAGLLLFTGVQPSTPFSGFWWMLAIVGVGNGLVMSPITTAIMSSVPLSRAGMASATSNTTRQVGGVFGIALLGSIVTHRFTDRLAAGLKPLNLPAEVNEKILAIAQQGRGAGAAAAMPGVNNEAIHTLINNSFTSGLHLALWVAGIVLLVGAVVGAVLVRGTAPHRQTAKEAASRAAGLAPVKEAE